MYITLYNNLARETN